MRRCCGPLFSLYFPFLFHPEAASAECQRFGGNLGDFVGNFRDNARIFQPVWTQFLVNWSLIKPHWDPRNATWEGLRNNFTLSWPASHPPEFFRTPLPLPGAARLSPGDFWGEIPRIWCPEAAGAALPDILADLDHPQIFPMDFLSGKSQMQQILILPLQVQLGFPQTRRIFYPKTGFWQSREDPRSVLERWKGKWGIYRILTDFRWG